MLHFGSTSKSARSQKMTSFFSLKTQLWLSVITGGLYPIVVAFLFVGMFVSAISGTLVTDNASATNKPEYVSNSTVVLFEKITADYEAKGEKGLTLRQFLGMYKYLTDYGRKNVEGVDFDAYKTGSGIASTATLDGKHPIFYSHAETVNSSKNIYPTAGKYKGDMLLPDDIDIPASILANAMAFAQNNRYLFNDSYSLDQLAKEKKLFISNSEIWAKVQECKKNEDEFKQKKSSLNIPDAFFPSKETVYQSCGDNGCSYSNSVSPISCEEYVYNVFNTHTSYNPCSFSSGKCDAKSWYYPSIRDLSWEQNDYNVSPGDLLSQITREPALKERLSQDRLIHFYIASWYWRDKFDKLFSLKDINDPTISLHYSDYLLSFVMKKIVGGSESKNDIGRLLSDFFGIQTKGFFWGDKVLEAADPFEDFFGNIQGTYVNSMLFLDIVSKQFGSVFSANPQGIEHLSIREYDSIPDVYYDTLSGALTVKKYPKNVTLQELEATSSFLAPTNLTLASRTDYQTGSVAYYFTDDRNYLFRVVGDIAIANNIRIGDQFIRSKAKLSFFTFSEAKYRNVSAYLSKHPNSLTAIPGSEIQDPISLYVFVFENPVTLF